MVIFSATLFLLVFGSMAPVLANSGIGTLPRSSGEQAFVLPKIEADDDTVDPKVADAFQRAGAAYGRRDYQAALAAWQTLAETGFGPAQYNLGVMHEHGRGVSVDYAAAAYWYHEAAEHEVPGAMVNLARLHFQGRGVKRNAVEALGLLEQASQLGSAEAQFNLGVAYLKGLGTKIDAEEAVTWFEMAAESGHARAAYNLAVLHQKGEAVAQDLDEAARLYAVAAEAGDALSHYALGKLLSEAKPTGQAKEIAARAVHHLTLAAEAGVALAQNHLAIMLARGTGVMRDREAALMWFHVAAGLGAVNAARNRDALGAVLAPQVRARAKKRADAFRPKPVLTTP